MKNVLLDPEKTVDRKLREAVMAFQLERTHTKEAILEGYLNRIYFGNGAYGVQAAAQLYFDKPASAVTLAEGALLAGVIQAPENYDPFTAPDAALARRQVVLGRMRELGSAAEADIAAAEAAPLGVVAKPSDTPLSRRVLRGAGQALRPRRRAVRRHPGRPPPAPLRGRAAHPHHRRPPDPGRRPRKR